MPLTSYGGGGGDWLQSLLAQFGAGQPYGPGGAPAGGAGPQGLMPGGGTLGYQAATPGAPSLGYPAFGGFHPGNIFQSHPPGSPTLGPVFNASGSPGGPGAGPGGPGSAGNDAGFNNPYMAAAAANPAQGGPYVGSGPPGMPIVTPPGPAPAGVGGPYVGGQGPAPIDANNPLPWRASPAATVANAPPGNPSATPRPARPVTRTPASAYPKRTATPASSINPRFGQVQYQVPGSGSGPLSRNPIYSTLNLFGGKA